MEPRFGHDFSKVRVHTDALAAQAASDVGASAWTVGNRIAFAEGEYRPGTRAGDRLLLHELTHTIQARGVPSSGGITIGDVDDPAEREACEIAAGLGHTTTKNLQRAPDSRLWRDVDVDLEPVSPAAASGMKLPGATSVLPLLPGYSQKGDTCGAASLVSALIIWDREHKFGTPNKTTVDACDLILIAFKRHGPAAIAERKKHLKAGVSPSAVDKMHDDLRDTVEATRDSARSGRAVSEPEYQLLGLALYFLWGGGAGLSAGEISAIQASLGLEATGATATTGISSFAEIWSSSLFTSLAPDQFAQIGWYVRTSPASAATATYGHHALLAGRLADGTWFWSDQGPSPAREFNAKTIGELEKMVRAAAATGYWIFTGGLSDFTMFTVGGWTGIKMLTGPSGVDLKIREQVPLGAFLGEVDAGVLTTGDALYRGAALGRRYTFADAEALVASSAGRSSALIIEMPVGVFHAYLVNAVSTDNLGEKKLDEADSTKGVLPRKEFEHAWVILGDAKGSHGILWKYY
jgi:hypothetical protein